jgi:arylsulfatase A-like enzyme
MIGRDIYDRHSMAHSQLDLAGVPHPGKTFRDRPVLSPKGKSWTRWLAGNEGEVHDENAVHGWERESWIGTLICCDAVLTRYGAVVFGQAAIRQGKWKAVWLPPPTGNGGWLLFDLSSGTSLRLSPIATRADGHPSHRHADPGETTDLARTHPERLVVLVQYWHEYEAETGTILRPVDEHADGGFGRFTGVNWADWGQ